MSTVVVLPNVTEASAFRIMGRLFAAGVLAKQADISAITYSLRNWETTAEISSGTLTVSDVVFDLPQVDREYMRGEKGYNFRWDAPHTLLVANITRYRLEITVTLSSTSEEVVFPFDIPATLVYSG